MMAPITPAYAEECWSILYPNSNNIFGVLPVGWPEPDGTLEMTEHSSISCAVQVNGKLRCLVPIASPPEDLQKDSKGLSDWVVDQILRSDEAQTKLMKEDCDIRKARKVFVVKKGQTANFVV
jgi:leucyl-tRNA synthetase